MGVDLLVKERRLFELKLVEKEKELEDLKSKAQISPATTTIVEKTKQPVQTHWYMLMESTIGTDLSGSPLSRITHLNISNQKLRKSDFSLLIQRTQWLKAMRTIDLSNNYFDDTALEEITKLLAQNLQGINLSRNRLGQSSLNVFCSYLSSRNCTLTWLNLHGNVFDDLPGTGEQFGKAVQANKSLIHLEVTLSDTKRRSPANTSTFIAQFSKSPANVASLGLTYRQLSKKTVLGIMKNLKSLTALDLSYSFIGIHGIQVIAAALKIKGHSSLIQLNLCANAIGESGAHVLGLALETNKTLTDLNLGNNQLNDTAIRYLSSSLNLNQTLTKLNVSRNLFTEDGCLVLFRLSQKRKQLISMGDLSVLYRHTLQHQLDKNTGMFDKTRVQKRLNHPLIQQEITFDRFKSISKVPILQPCVLILEWEVVAASSEIDWDWKLTLDRVLIATGTKHQVIPAVIDCFGNQNVTLWMKSNQPGTHLIQTRLKTIEQRQDRYNFYQSQRISIETSPNRIHLLKKLYMYYGGSIQVKWTVRSDKDMTNCVWKITQTRQGFSQVIRTIEQGNAASLDAHLTNTGCLCFSVRTDGWKTDDVLSISVSSCDSQQLELLNLEMSRQMTSTPRLNFASPNPFQ